MSHAGQEHEAQRELEQHALRNVSWLAAKLGYRDALDARTEKGLVIALGLLAALAIAGFAGSALVKAGDDQRELERRRCMVAAQIEVLPQVTKLIQESRRDLTVQRQQQLISEQSIEEARSKCGKEFQSR